MSKKILLIKKFLKILYFCNIQLLFILILFSFSFYISILHLLFSFTDTFPQVPMSFWIWFHSNWIQGKCNQQKEYYLHCAWGNKHLLFLLAYIFFFLPKFCLAFYHWPPFKKKKKDFSNSQWSVWMKHYFYD